METAQVLSYPPRVVPELAWRPVQKFVQLMRQVQQVAVGMVRQVRDVVNPVLRTLKEITPRTSRARTSSQAEWIVGPLTFSVASEVIFAR